MPQEQELVEIKGTEVQVLAHQNIEASDIEDVQAVYATGRCNDRTVEQLTRDGFEVLSILAIREDSVSFHGGDSAVEHKIVTVMVKRKK